MKLLLCEVLTLNSAELARPVRNPEPNFAAEHTPSLVRTQKKPAVEHLFVTNVRFLSMAAVVAMHAVESFAPVAGVSLSSSLAHAMLQVFKFGTIGFFLISGFLMGEGLTRRAPKEYLKRRIHTVLMPWLLWFSLFCVKTFAGDIIHGRFGYDSVADWALILNQIKDCMFGTAYWFVPNLMLAICVLLICRRFLFDLRLGCVLLALSLLYAANIYTGWIPISGHAKALFGFVFYLWLGAWAAKNFASVQTWLARVPMSALMFAVLLAGVAAYAESEALTSLGKVDDMNSLRVSNQIYSVAMVVTTVKARSSLSLRGINVRATTFGIYLTHTIALSFLLNLAIRALPNLSELRPSGIAGPAAACLSMAGFAIAYGIALASTRLLLRFPRLRWTVGAFPSEGKPMPLAGPRRGVESLAGSIPGDALCRR